MPMAIEETVSAAEANRSFSRLLRGVREGRRYIVTVRFAKSSDRVAARAGQ
jgi:antitoxin (DNA-binding transcriptional repressor) of toxin-antitoxin stability system